MNSLITTLWCSNTYVTTMHVSTHCCHDVLFILNFFKLTVIPVQLSTLQCSKVLCVVLPKMLHAQIWGYCGALGSFKWTAWIQYLLMCATMCIKAHAFKIPHQTRLAWIYRKWVKVKPLQQYSFKYTCALC